MSRVASKNRVKRAKYVVRYEPIEDGWWLASVPAVPECITQGRSLRQARARAREALALCVGDAVAARAELTDEIALPQRLGSTLERALVERTRAEEARASAAAATTKAVRRLVASGISTRDAAELLGVSHQRVAQIAGARD